MNPKTFTIRQAENGFVVRLKGGKQMVFETLDALFAFLKEEFTPKDS